MSKPPKYVPIFTNRWITGLWTQRSPLRDAATPYLYEKFYSGSRFESLIDGSNCELSNRLTLQRRPGHTVYNSATFPTIDSFYAFKTFTTNSETIRVIADTSTGGTNNTGIVYDATGPNNQIALLEKGLGAGQTFFQGVGNNLYMGDGVEQKQWVYTDEGMWLPNTVYSVGAIVQDTNYNVQTMVGFSYPPLTAITSVHVTGSGTSSNILTIVFTEPFFQNPTSFGIGSTFYLNFGTYQTLNLVPLTLVSQSTTVVGFVATVTLTFNVNAANYGPAADTGTFYVESYTVSHFNGSQTVTVITSATSGTTEPAWATSIGSFTFDSNTILWQLATESVVDWAPIGPTFAPTCTNVAAPNLGNAWAANTYYFRAQVIVDSNGNIQQLTTAGTTNGSVPMWMTGLNAVTGDNTVQWTNLGTATRATSTAYTAGQYISVTFYITKYYPKLMEYITFGPYTQMYVCTTAGTSSAAATSSLAWTLAYNGTVYDGSVIWTNQGAMISRQNAATSNTNIGYNQLVSTFQTIVDSVGAGGGKGNIQKLQSDGESGSTAPNPWNTVLNVTTQDNEIAWVCEGPATTGETLPWIYSYSFVNSSTGAVSNSSPQSTGVTLLPSSAIAVNGQGDLNFATDGVDTIEIYRSVAGGSTCYFLADIPAPSNGGPWQYIDTSYDPGQSGTSTLNELIEAPVDDSNSPPPTGLVNLTYNLGRIWGSVVNVVYWCGGPDTTTGSGNCAWPPANNFVFPSKVVRLWPNGASGMLVFTVSDVYVITGLGTTSSPFFAQPFLANVGLSSYNAFDINGSVLYMMTTDGHVIELDPNSGISEVGFPIGDKFDNNYVSSSAYVTWHVAGSEDKALYVADGKTGWYRMNPTPAPESGTTWSPFATVAQVGGVQAVQSTEVLPGTRKLLVGPGPGQTGVILERNLGVFSDNGTPYPCFATIGSIVLAQPGELAEVAFFMTECGAVGSRPTVSVLLDELSGSFESLPTSVNASVLPTSTTVYNDWFYLTQGALPAICRHLQLKVTFSSTDTVQNELLTYSIFGRHFSERG